MLFPSARRLAAVSSIVLLLSACSNAQPSNPSPMAHKPAEDSGLTPKALDAPENSSKLFQYTKPAGPPAPELEQAEVRKEAVKPGIEIETAPISENREQTQGQGSERKPAVERPQKTATSTAASTASKAKASTKKAATAKQLTLSQLVKKYPRQLRLHGSSSKKQVALTFDDAPDSTFTPQVLDILKKHKVRATFFLVGNQVEKNPQVVQRIINEGHVIGNHSYSHKLFTKLDDQNFQKQLLQAQQAISKQAGYSPKLVRPPYGEIKESQLLWASDNGYLIVNWNVDSLDWKQLSEKQVAANILNHTRNGSIILQHSGGGPSQDLSGTVQALPHVIDQLKSQGYRLVTLPELLKVNKEK